MAEYVDFHYMPLEGKITGKQVLKQTEDAINDLGQHVYEIDIDNELIQQAIDTSNQAIDTAEAALSAVTTNRAMWFNTVSEMRETDIALGITAATRGKGVFNDGDGAFYAVRAIKGGDVDSDDTVFLDNGNVAERIKQFNLVAKGNNIVYVANVADLRASDAVAGLVYGTTGYYSPNDGGAGVYNIRTATLSDVDNGGSIIILDNGNVAELIIGDSVNVHQLGAKGNANYYNYTDGNSYVNADTSSATAANYIDNVTTDIVKNYVSAVFETEGTYLNPADGKHYVNYDEGTDTYTDEAPYHDNVADKWYVTATYSNKANALLNGTWYYGVVFSTPANDDTTAIQNAINTHKPIELLHGHTYIVTSFTVYNGLVIYGNGGTLRRPNLKLSPYLLTDNNIKWLRMFNLTAEVVGENVNDVLTEIHDITIDCNAFAMWNPLVDNNYKYEQGVVFTLGGTDAHQCRVLFDNVKFLNEYASSVTVNNYVDIIMQNCSAWNCMKGVCTVVGDANNVNISNALCDSGYGFTAFWYEPNANIDGRKTTININNAIFYGRFECVTNKNAVVNVANSLMHMRSADFVINQNAILQIVNSEILMTSGENIYVRGYGKLLIENCDIGGGGLAFTKTASNDYYVTCLIANSVLHDSAVGIVVYENTQSDVSVNGCRFYAISNRCFGARVGASKTNFKRFVVTNCVFDVECYIYQSNSDTNLRTVTFGGGNDVVNASNQGIYIYGADAITMKDEMWSAPVKIVTYRSGASYNPIGFGKRTTLVAEAPTFRGINDVDHAQLTVSPYTKYTYTNNAWVADT